MTDESNAPPSPRRTKIWLRDLLFIGLCVVLAGVVVARLWSPKPLPGPSHFDPAEFARADFVNAVERLDKVFEVDWKDRGIKPVPDASAMMVARRLSLGLTGTVPSFEELRALEQQPEENQLQWWLSHLFEDRRSSEYLAERFARAYVGVENGPFLVYRRRRMVDWLSEEFAQNRPYDQITRSLIAAKGLWTTSPEANFITVTTGQNMEKKGPDEEKLAARVTRAFLGVRIDCVQCHDDMFGPRWKQKDFHQLAAFFAPTENSISGIRDDEKKQYQYRYKGTPSEVMVPAVVPFQPELFPASGELRERLATWVTHPKNRAFARTTVNRIWALMFNRPLVEPIDSIPLEGPYPPGLELLVDDMIDHGYDLRRLVRVIATSRIYRLDSRSDDPATLVTKECEQSYAAFPLTRLRPEQVAGSVIQAASLRTIDAEAHVLFRIMRSTQTSNFVKRYGDFGDDEFDDRGGTIPQRLLLMNGELLKGRTEKNPLFNASSRIGSLSRSDSEAVEAAYLCTLTRRPEKEELDYFVKLLDGTKGDKRQDVMADIFWTLMNSTEFAWNH